MVGEGQVIITITTIMITTIIPTMITIPTIIITLYYHDDFFHQMLFASTPLEITAPLQADQNTSMVPPAETIDFSLIFKS